MDKRNNGLGVSRKRKQNASTGSRNALFFFDVGFYIFGGCLLFTGIGAGKGSFEDIEAF